ncbi:MAG: four helix bundle protein, partial [Nitrospiraceae bacterium]
MSKSLIQEKSFSFAVRIVLYCRTHLSGKDDVVLSRQLLRSGTSIGANVEEALGGQSRKDYIAKLGIAARETREAHYWLRLIQKVKTDHHSESISLGKECEELLKILNSIILTTRRNLISSNSNSRLRTQNSELL